MKDLQNDFLTGMQLLAASATIITSASDDKRAGMVATAVCSLAADPPSLLICANRTSRTYGHILQAGRFVVNVVPDDRADLVAAFASKDDKETQFRKAGTWTASAHGMPVLDEAVAAFECRVTEVTDTSTHAVFFAEVDQVHVDPTKSALIYARQSFSKLTPLTAE